MTITLDIGAVLSAIMWPAVILILVLAFRKKLPDLVEGLVGRITKVGFAGVGPIARSVALLEAEGFLERVDPARRSAATMSLKE